MKLTSILGVLLAALTVGCASNSGSPVSPSAGASTSQESRNTVIWGSSTGGTKLYYQVSIDTGALGNPSPLGSDVTATIWAVNGIPGRNVNFSVNYGTVVNGPQSVTLPAFQQSVSFTVHTTGTGTDAHVSVPSQNTNVPAHVSTNTVIWGS